MLPLFRNFCLAAIILDMLLVLLGLALHPSAIAAGGLLGAGGAILMLACFGWLALGSPISLFKAPEAVWRFSALAGVAGGAWLGVDLLLNYFIYRDGPTNSKISLIVYGVYALLLLICAARGSSVGHRFVDGLAGAAWFIIPAQLIWFAVEFGAYYLFAGTKVGAAFLQTEMAADFARSGMADFQTFAMTDFYGAGFFHLLLIGLGAALLLGSLGSGLGLLISTRRP